eukprot:TRINITY_DN2434_c0_g1_i4.p1 TRINITY_DN2434_c0_g1~~TRINITY_DN2434_c0_g1_i4.p1  ORF type:complete len:940 (-),score=136.85 TRINITY_DN2434_c0_g1_i4:251-3070(-)
MVEEVTVWLTKNGFGEHGQKLVDQGFTSLADLAQNGSDVWQEILESEHVRMPILLQKKFLALQKQACEKPACELNRDSPQPHDAKDDVNEFVTEKGLTELLDSLNEDGATTLNFFKWVPFDKTHFPKTFKKMDALPLGVRLLAMKELGDMYTAEEPGAETESNAQTIGKCLVDFLTSRGLKQLKTVLLEDGITRLEQLEVVQFKRENMPRTYEKLDELTPAAREYAHRTFWQVYEEAAKNKETKKQQKLVDDAKRTQSNYNEVLKPVEEAAVQAADQAGQNASSARKQAESAIGRKLKPLDASLNSGLAPNPKDLAERLKKDEEKGFLRPGPESFGEPMTPRQLVLSNNLLKGLVRKPDGARLAASDMIQLEDFDGVLSNSGKSDHQEQSSEMTMTDDVTKALDTAKSIGISWGGTMKASGAMFWGGGIAGGAASAETAVAGGLQNHTNSENNRSINHYMKSRYTIMRMKDYSVNVFSKSVKLHPDLVSTLDKIQSPEDADTVGIAKMCLNQYGSHLVTKATLGACLIHAAWAKSKGCRLQKAEESNLSAAMTNKLNGAVAAIMPLGGGKTSGGSDFKADGEIQSSKADQEKTTETRIEIDRDHIGGYNCSDILDWKGSVLESNRVWRVVDRDPESLVGIWVLIRHMSPSHVKAAGILEREWSSLNSDGLMRNEEELERERNVVAWIEQCREERHLWLNACTKGEKHGLGITWDLEGPICTFIYKGQFASGRYNGGGKKVFIECLTTYTGQFKDGLFHGKGTIVWLNGESYTGEYEKGRRHGTGRYVWSSDGKYDGEYDGQWQQGEYHGKGKRVYASGGFYDGQWQQGEKHGKGRHVWSSGGEYDGEWEQGEFHGEGKREWGDGCTYDGQWQQGHFHGEGKYEWKLEKRWFSNDCVRYIGQWQKGARHGQGKEVYSDGTVVEGEFKEDKFVKEKEGERT